MVDDTSSKSPRRKRPEIFNPPVKVPKITGENRRTFRRVPTKALIEDRLYWRIRGYDYEEVTEELREVEAIDPDTGAEVIRPQMVTVKIVHKQVAPDVGAIIFGATNLIPEKYKNKSAVDLNAKVDGLSQLLDEIDGSSRGLPSRRNDP